MTDPVLSSLLPVVLLIAVGWLTGKRGWIGRDSVKDLSNLVFLVLTPALLFRTMAAAQFGHVAVAPLAAYFLGAGIIFAATLALQGLNRRAAVIGLANTFSNTFMIGVPLIGLAYGQAGLVPLLMLISVHALVMLTIATVVLELAVQREAALAGTATRRGMLRPVLRALRSAVIHPVPLPILAGLLFAQTGLNLPDVVDKPLQLLGSAFGPMALVLVGVTVAHAPVGPHWRGALSIALVKNLLMPLLVFAVGRALGVTGLPLTVMVVAGALPVGANVFLFSQRYGVAQELVTASVAVSAALGMVTVTLVMMALQVI